MITSNARCLADLPDRFNAADDILRPNLEQGRGTKTAIIDTRGALSYQALSERVDRMAGAIRRWGFEPGDRVLLCLLDTRDFPTVFLGAIKAGVIPVPLNTLLTADDYHWIVANSEARGAFVSGDLADRWQGIANDYPQLTMVSSEGGPWSDLEAAIESARPIPEPAATRAEDIAFWLYTSGSTGKPKGAMHRHAALRLTANLYGRGVVGYRESDTVLSVAKLFFAYGLGNALSFPLAVGATVVLNRDRPLPEIISDLLKTHQVSILCGVPTFFAGWLNSDDCPTQAQLPSLRQAVSAGEALPAHLGETFKTRFGTDILDGLGSTEMTHIFVSQRPGQVRYGCTGRVVDGYEIRVVDENGVDVPEGDIGNLIVRGDSSAAAYWNNPEKTATTFQNGWTLTGDKYTIDGDGWLTYAGRMDDMLKVGGIYVSPIEVEEALSSHDSVLEAAVVGAEDDEGLVKPHAYVVLKAGAEPDEQALKAHVKAQLAPYKYPRWFSFVTELPKTATGKIQRFKLRAS